jgi:hypothetical protein
MRFRASTARFFYLLKTLLTQVFSGLSGNC